MSKKNYTLPRKRADRNQLYQWAVQNVEHEIDLTLDQYESRRGRLPRILREDFCGTGLIASQWVQDHPERHAIGLDLDPETLAWARDHNLAPLGGDSRRVDLRCCDVRTVTEPKADVVHACNFSYFQLYPLATLIEYFQCVHQSLAADGIFLMDCYGGWEYMQPHKDRRTVTTPQGTFGFVWEHDPLNPITNRVSCHIHFEFKNGKRWKNAFNYDFRIYSLAEVRDALTAAGFAKVETLWDFADEDDRSDFRPTLRAENCPRWIAYLVAEAT